MYHQETHIVILSNYIIRISELYIMPLSGLHDYRPALTSLNRPRFHCSLQWRNNGWDIVSNHQPHGCLLNRLFRRRSKKTLKFRVIGLCTGNSPGTGEFPAQMASNVENVSIWWRHHVSRAVLLRPDILQGRQQRQCRRDGLCRVLRSRWPLTHEYSPDGRNITSKN